MTEPSEGLSDRRISNRWREISDHVDRVMDRVGQRDGFEVLSRSSLSKDDRDTDPYQLSHAVRHCSAIGTDNLHALTQLVVKDQVLHLSAPYTLARAALEVFSAAFTMLHPSSRTVRIENLLRWHAQNINDQHKATNSLALNEKLTRTKEEKLDNLESIANRHGVGRQFRQGATSTHAAKYATQHTNHDVLLCWQICSGFAHGRQWASLGTSDRETFDTDDPNVSYLRMTSSLTTVLYPVNGAELLLRDLIKLWENRSRPQC